MYVICVDVLLGFIESFEWSKMNFGDIRGLYRTRYRDMEWSERRIVLEIIGAYSSLGRHLLVGRHCSRIDED